MKRTDKLKDRILTINEKIFDGYSETRKIEFLAGRFVAKAFSKALGTGLGEQCKLHDLEVLKGATGNPVLYFKDELVNGFVSITHSKHTQICSSNLIRIVLNLSKRLHVNLNILPFLQMT